MVYVLLADGFETIEALAPVDMLRRAGVDVRTVSVKPNTLEVVSSQKVCVQADIGLDQLKIEDMSMLVIPGGMPGTTNLDHLEQMDELFEPGKEIICYRDPGEVPELVRWWLDHPEARRKVVEAGRKRVLACHTWEARLRSMLDTLKSVFG